MTPDPPIPEPDHPIPERGLIAEWLRMMHADEETIALLVEARDVLDASPELRDRVQAAAASVTESIDVLDAGWPTPTGLNAHEDRFVRMADAVGRAVLRASAVGVPPCTRSAAIADLDAPGGSATPHQAVSSHPRRRWLRAPPLAREPPAGSALRHGPVAGAAGTAHRLSLRRRSHELHGISQARTR